MKMSAKERKATLASLRASGAVFPLIEHPWTPTNVLSCACYGSLFDGGYESWFGNAETLRALGLQQDCTVALGGVNYRGWGWPE